jgi:hypothetical protein
MLIRFLSAMNFKAHCITYPLRAFSRQLARQGLRIKIHLTPRRSLGRCDVLFVLSEYFRTHSGIDRLELLKRYRQKVDTLIYLDTTASTGTTSFEVLPFVDLYAKSQLLRDRAQYTQTFYGLRCYTEYYHRRYGLVDGAEEYRQPASADQLEKLAVSWNLGLGDYHTFATWPRRLRILLPWADYQVPVTPVDVPRDIDVSFRGSVGYGRATIAFQRQETRRQLEEMAASGNYQIEYGGKLPYHEYRAEMGRTRVAPSPYAWGEICFRDFECFLSGATLLKPDMGHLETWPDHFEPDVTYVAHAWDFSDFQEKTRELLESPARCQRIARSGQKRYLATLSEPGGEEFAEHLAALVSKARRESRI